jgi:hypothetical protein
MLISLLLLTLIAVGGLALTYLIETDEPLMWRLAAGTVIGSAVFGLVTFVGACIFGFSPAVVLVSLAITLLPVLMLRRRDVRDRFAHDRAKARGKLDGANLKKFRAFAYYAFFVALFWFFFDRAMYFGADGSIFTGGSQNLGDLPFHLGAIFSFTDGSNFPPQNPSWAGAKFSYPFMADLVTAAFVRLGAGVREAMFALDMAWAFSLFVILERFVVRLTGNKLAGRIAPALLFFTGGLGFLWFFKDAWGSTTGVLDILRHIPRDYTIGDQFRWGNSMVVLFITQRSLLLGMPITLIVLGYLWKIFATENTENSEKNSPSIFGFSVQPFFVGLIAGMLPLIHLHSLVVLFVVTAFLFVLRYEKWHEWIAFGIGVAVIAVPELIWSMSGSASETTEFFGWHFGWDKGENNFLWFWIKNTGILIPVLIAGIWLFLTQRRKDAKAAKAEDLKPNAKDLLLFYVPFAFLFVIANIAKLAPWEWDNIKILIYWFVGSLPFIAYAIAWGWQRGSFWSVASAACFLALTLSGALDVWRTASGQIKAKVFDADAVKVAEQIKQKVDPHAIILNAPTYNSAVVLSGRPSLMRYSGHLSSHGIDYLPRENDVKRIYEGGGVADILMRKYDISYVLISPEERTALKANEEFFKRYPLAAEAGEYRVYKVK